MLRLALVAALSPAVAKDFLAKSVTATCHLQGWADATQKAEVLKVAEDCFSWNPIATQTISDIQTSLTDATDCVLYNLEQRWGWKPELFGRGGDIGGPYDTQGRDGKVVVGVSTPTGKWKFALAKGSGAPSSGGSSSAPAAPVVTSLHRGDASAAQEAELIHFAETCFAANEIDTSNVGSLDSSLGRAVGCVLDKCQQKWGWKPLLTGEGSNSGGPYDTHGLGATVIGAETSAGKWEFILHLKY